MNQFDYYAISNELNQGGVAVFTAKSSEVRNIRKSLVKEFGLRVEFAVTDAMGYAIIRAAFNDRFLTKYR